MTRWLPFLLFAALLPTLGRAAETPKGWTAIVWPNAALLAQQTTRDGYLNLTQSMTCVPGDDQVTVRVYARGGQPRPPGARKGCDTQCRTEIVVTGSDGRNPAGYSERKLPWSEASRIVATDAPKASADFARACGLQLAKPSAVSPLQRDASAARNWSDPKVAWRLIGSGGVQSTLPFDFAIPAGGWQYAAMSSSLTTRAPAIVRIEVEGLSGRSGVALVKPDGTALVSGEYVIAAGDRAIVHFRLNPGAPATVLLRNYDDDGAAGVLRVLRMDVVAEAALTPQALAAIQASLK